MENKKPLKELKDVKAVVTPKPVELDLDLKTNNRQVIKLMQGYNYSLKCNIFDDNDAINVEGATVQIHFRKADDKFIIQSGDTSISGNVIITSLNKDFTRVHGFSKLQIVLSSGGKIFGSWVIDTIVEECAVNDNVGESENKITVTETLVDKIAQATQSVKGFTQECLNKMLEKGDLTNMTIKNGSITKEKFTDELQEQFDKMKENYPKVEEVIKVSSNLYNTEDEDIFEGRIGGSGSNIVDERYITTGFIPCTNGDKFYCTRENKRLGEWVEMPFIYHYVYNDRKERIGAVRDGNSNGIINISDSEVKFFRITYEKTYNDGTEMISKEPNATFRKFGEKYINKKQVDEISLGIKKDINKDIDNKFSEKFPIKIEDTNFICKSVNIFNMNDVDNKDGYTLSSSQKITEQTTRNDSKYISHIIPINYGDILRINLDFDLIYCYDKNGDYTRGYTQKQFPSRVITMDRENITQLRIQFDKEQIVKNGLSNYMVTINNELPKHYQSFQEISLDNGIGLNKTQKDLVKEIAKKESGNGSNVLSGKVLACAGDSITYGYKADTDETTGWKKNYGALTALRNGMKFYNYGVSGSCLQGSRLSNGGDSKGFSYESGRYTKMVDDIDYLTIWFGWNDSAYGTLGTIEDSTNNSFYGAWNVVIPYLIDKYPTTKIGLIVPYGATGGHRKAVREIAKKYGLGYLDLYAENVPMFYGRESMDSTLQEIARKRQKTFLADGTHPNQTGYEYLSTIFENWLRSL